MENKLQIITTSLFLLILFVFFIFCNQVFAVNFQHVLLENIKELDIGLSVQTEGVVIVEPGVFGSQFFYINGVQIYSYYKDFPRLKRGDKIVVRGIISQSHEEKRINIKDIDDIEILERQLIVQPQVVEIKEINYNLVGKLLKIQGEVIERTGSRIFISNGQSEITIYIKEYTEINKAIIQEGDNLEIIGILNQSNNELRILPRNNKDIRFIVGEPDVLLQANLDSLTLEGSGYTPIVRFESIKLYFIISTIILSIIFIILIVVKKIGNKKD